MKQKITKYSSLISAALFCLVVSASQVLANESEGHAAGGHHGGFSDLIPYWAHFLVYVGLLYWFVLRNGLPNVFKNRSARIDALVVKGRAELTSATEALAAAQKKHASLQQDIQNISAQIEADAKREVALILEDGARRSQKAIATAKELAQAESKSAQAAIQKEVATMVIDSARTRLKTEVTAQSDLQLREAAIRGVKGLL